MSAILFGSISTLADTSEIQRKAFNDAFAAHDLDWNWSREDYISMLGSNGGAQRIADYAESKGVEVDAAAVHATKSEIAQSVMAASALTARPGVRETIQTAKDNGFKVGFVTTTSPANIAALLTALGPDVDAGTFDVIVDSSSVETSKPDAASYLFALSELGEEPGNCVAIEDNVGGVAAANAADLRCVAFPNENTVSGDFSAAVETVDALDAERLRSLVGAA